MATGIPQRVDIPAAVQQVAAGRSLRLVWENERGGLTFAVEDGGAPCFVKWAPAGSGLELGAEADRLTWARRFTAVPAVLDLGDDGDGAWLVTTPLPGTSAVDPRWTADPAAAVRGIGQGLRGLHDAGLHRGGSTDPVTWSRRPPPASSASSRRRRSGTHCVRVVVVEQDPVSSGTRALWGSGP